MNRDATEQTPKTSNAKDELKDIFLEPTYGIKGEPMGDDRNHKSFFGRTSFAARRSLILFISCLAIGCITILFFYGDKLYNSSFKQVREANNFSKQIFKIKSEIVALTSDSNNFIWTNNFRYARNYRDRAKQLNLELKILLENQNFPTSQKLSTTLFDGITEHKKQFSKVTEIQTLLGFNGDIGILANANASLANLEKRLSQLKLTRENVKTQILLKKITVIETELAQRTNMEGQEEVNNLFNRLGTVFVNLPLKINEQKALKSLLQSHRNDITQLFRTQNTYNKAIIRLGEINDYIAPSIETIINYSENLSLLTLQESKETQLLIRKLIPIGTISIILILCVSYMLTLRSITRPGTKVAETAVELAHGNVSAPIPYLANSDSIGQLANTLTIFRENMLQADRLRKDLEITRRENLHPSVELIPNAHNLEHIEGQKSESPTPAIPNEQILVKPDNPINNSTISNISNKITTTSQNASDAFEEVERTEIMVSGLEDTAESIENIEVLMIGISDQISLLAVQMALHKNDETDNENLVQLYEKRDTRKTKMPAGSSQSVDGRIQLIQDGTKQVLKDIHKIGATVDSVNKVAREVSNTISQEALIAANQLLKQSEDLRKILDNILDKTQNEQSTVSKPKI